MPYLSRAGDSLYYEVHGEGPVIVLAHGVGGNHVSWFEQVPVLSRSYRVITFDHRGFGKSSDSSGLGRGAFVDDLQALLDELRIERAALVGQSMGAGTCVGLTARAPARVAALVLADSVQGLEEVDGNRAILAEARAATSHLGQLERVLGEDFLRQHAAASFLYSQLAGFNATDRHNLTGVLGPLVHPRELAAARVPVLFIVGEQDRLFPPAAVQAAQRETAGSFYVEISGAGHSAYFERPVEFNDSVLSFLQAVGYRGKGPAAHSNSRGYAPVR